MRGPVRWKQIGKTRGAAEFLMAREPWCVAAGARFLRFDRSRDRLWEWPGPAGETRALILQSRRTIFPVSSGGIIPSPPFIADFLQDKPFAFQGLRGEVEQMEEAAAEKGFYPGERIDYDLMALDEAPPLSPSPRPPGLFVRSPRPEDGEALFALQAAYEREEVVPRGADFNPALCRANLDRILARERVLVAELNSEVVGKINTSAFSFRRFQIGGVYVRPDYRGQGIARSMIRAFTRQLLAEGQGLSLFVKKRNGAARAVYRESGFTAIGDYRISYYSA